MNLYVGNISFQLTQEDLHAAFAEYGNVTRANIITDRDTGRSKGFAFVEMENDAEGKAAIDGLNGREMGGRDLRVSEARPREEKPRTQKRW
jgi:RNA recognition motif-containing protein